jgi:hypothetical protein
VTSYDEVPIRELLEPVGGRAKFIREFIEAHPGEYPVYSASLVAPFGYIDEYDYYGKFLTWVMNGYGGRVQEVSGRFSLTRDRGVFLPRSDVRVPDLTYLRFAMEPQLTAAAVGRRVDGRLNEYTKIYPETAGDVVIQLPLCESGDFDYERMAKLGEKFRRIEAAQAGVRRAHEPLERAVFPVQVSEPTATISLADRRFFNLSIGERVLRADHVAQGVPVYSANVLVPFGAVATTNLTDFQRPSLLWGIDGNFDWNLIQAGVIFATTDHCGRLQVVDARIDAEYLYWFLRATRERYGFDRVFRASLANMKAEGTVTIPLDFESHEFSVTRQRVIAAECRQREQARAASLTSLDDVLAARIAVEM